MHHRLRHALARFAPQLTGIGLPLAIVALASWQWWRAQGYPAAAAGVRRSSGQIDQWLPVLAPAALVLALLALALYMLAWLALMHASRHALRSRDDLLHGFTQARRWLPGFLLLHTMLILLALLGVLSFELLHLLDVGPTSRAGRKGLAAAFLFSMALVVLLGLLVSDMLRFARHRPRPDPIVIMGRQLSPTQAPLLWDFVREIATRAGGSAPDTLVVGLNEGFFVTEYPVVLAHGEPGPPGRVLYLPLPYLAFMDHDQASSVIAHEMGHFIGEDTLYSTRFAPIYRRVAGAIHAIAGSDEDDPLGLRQMLTTPSAWFGRSFLSRFDHAVKHWSRVREHEADDVSRRVAGAETAAIALLRIAALTPLVEQARVRSQHAAEPSEGVLPLLRRLIAEHGLADPREHLQQCQPHPLDTHPPLHLRLAALGITPSPALIQASRHPAPSGLLAKLGLESSAPAGCTAHSHSTVPLRAST